MAILYHISPIRKWESTIQYVDRMLIMNSCSIVTILLLFRVDLITFYSPLFFLLILSIIISPLCYIDNINIGVNLCVLIIITGNVLLLHYNKIYHSILWDLTFNIIGSILSGVFYILELKSLRINSNFIGWHDIFHITTSLVYLHRIITIRPVLFNIYKN